jgi:hypothetical protein
MRRYNAHIRRHSRDMCSLIPCAHDGASSRSLIPCAHDKDANKSERVMEALLQMKKIDIQGLRIAYEGH